MAAERDSDACSCFLPVAGCVAVRARRESDDGEVVVSAGAGGGGGVVVPAAGGGRRRRRWAPSGAVVNISFAPGVSECWFGKSVKISLLGGWGLLSEWPLVDWARLC